MGPGCFNRLPETRPRHDRGHTNAPVIIRLTRVRQVTASSKTTNLGCKALEAIEAVLRPRPERGAGRALFDCAPWSGFEERPWFGAPLFLLLHMAAIEDLIKQVADPGLREQLAAEVARLNATKKFGLVFEEHLPELVRLPGLPVRSGVRVVKKDDNRGTTYRVLSTINGQRIKIAPEAGGAEEIVERGSVVVTKAFGEPMYPALVPVDAVERAPGKPWHVLINADNYHALQLLLYGYEGKVDVIYIDPPYNSGARDWKYNNNFVDDADQSRHSKWLSMMKRRLVLALRLLNPKESVMIVTIDEKECSRLGTLLEEVFRGCSIQMVSTLINPANVARAGSFGRNDEYIYFVMLGAAAPQRVRLDREWVSAKGRTHTGNIRWDLLRRSGPGSARKDSPGCFYPI